MTLIANPLKVRWLERIFLLLISLALGLLFFQLFTVLKKDFDEVPGRLRDGTMINLNDDKPGDKFKLLLTRGFYFTDQRDIELIGSAFERGRRSEVDPIDNIGELNKNRFSINAGEAYIKGGGSYKKRIDVSRALLGFSEIDSILLNQKGKRAPGIPAITSAGLGSHNISGTIKKNDGQPVAGVIVRLQMIIPPDSVYSSELSEQNKLVEFKNGIR